MEIFQVDLYGHYQVPPPPGRQPQAGTLRIYRGDSAVDSPHRRFPAVLIVPGGGYDHVSKREGEPVALRFAARGWVAAVLEYSVRPTRHPVQLREAAYAMRYLRENAKDLGVDPHRVAAVGFSAGGHLCGLLATQFDAPEVQDVAPWATLRPDALGLCYPVIAQWGRTHEGTFANLSGGDLALRRRLSVDKLVRPDMPPVYLWCTRDDPSVPCRNALVMAAALEEAGVDFALHVYRHGPHGLSTADVMAYPSHRLPAVSPDVPGWVEGMLGFFAEVGLGVEDRPPRRWGKRP